MTAAQINAINEAKKNGGRALTTAQVNAVGDDAGFEEATAMLEQFENELVSYTAELKNTGNLYSTLDREYIEEGMLDMMLVVDPFFGEVLERDAENMPEWVAELLENIRAMELEEILKDYHSMREAMDAGEYAIDEDGNDDPDGEHAMATIIMVLAYVRAEKESGVSLPKESDPVE
jgi:hypothetical protein